MAIAPDKIRVCAFSYYFPPHYSGAGLQTLTLAKELRQCGVQYFFVTVDNTGLPRHDTVQGFDVYRIADGPKKHGELVLWWNLWRRLYRLRDRFEIIHASGSTYRNSGVGIVGKMLGKKSMTVVSMAHNDLYHVGKTRIGKLQAYLLRHVDRYVSLSHEITEEIKGLPLERAKAVEIPQGVNTARFSPVAEDQQAVIRNELDLGKGPLALYAGVFDSRKNVEWLVKIWARHRSIFSRCRLLLIGPNSRDRRDAGLRARLKDFVRDQRLQNEIFFRDFTPAVENYYRAADLFILPSHNEGLPNVVLEAMSCGVPCVVTSISGTTDLIANGESGMLFEDNDEDSFICAIRPLLADPALRKKMGSRARTEIVERFSSRKSAERYLQLYQNILEEG